MSVFSINVYEEQKDSVAEICLLALHSVRTLALTVSEAGGLKTV